MADPRPSSSNGNSFTLLLLFSSATDPIELQCSQDIVLPHSTYNIQHNRTSNTSAKAAFGYICNTNYHSSLYNMYFFSAKINKLGINPYVLLPPLIRAKVFKDAGKDKGAIPVRIELNKKQFIQTLVKYKRRWRLYLNGPMRIAAGRDVGDTVEAGIEFDPGD